MINYSVLQDGSSTDGTADDLLKQEILADPVCFVPAVAILEIGIVDALLARPALAPTG